MKQYFADLHVHVGFSCDGKPVKISGARNLTVKNIIDESSRRKGINIIGLVDCASPRVYQDIDIMIEKGEITPHPKGGLLLNNDFCLIPAVEIETIEGNNCVAHSISFFPDMYRVKQFSNTMTKYIRNINLSSQRAYITARELLGIVESLGGEFIPAHCFSPHKSFYGKCTTRLQNLFGSEMMNKINAIELGLSADSDMADKISELKDKTFVSNSDAHSLSKIAREYNVLQLKEPSFSELIMALKRQNGRMVLRNYGLDPELGKYHRTFCLKCGHKNESQNVVVACDSCGEKSKIVMGVYDRIETIKDNQKCVHPKHRPPYIKQVPLEFIPGIGKKTINKLIYEFGNEMNVIHNASIEDISRVTGKAIAQYISLARDGKLKMEKGAGGVYGKIKSVL